MATMNGAAMAVFSVRLSEASTNVINVPWQTEDGTGHAGTDYEAASGTLTFPAGSLEQTLQVEVYGRSPQDSTEDRTFLIRLDPPVDAILENATAECVIQVVAQDGNVFTQVYIPAGPRGRPGNTGDTGLNTFQLAVLNGFAGTLTQWLATVTGRNVELINDGTWINWRPVDFENPQPWMNLIELATISGKDGEDGDPGDPGNDGREVQMQKSATAIQWRYTGEATWHDLVQLDDLKADPQPLVNRGNWATGTTYNPGDYVAATSSSSTVKSLYFLLDGVPYVSNAEPKNDASHWVELQPPQGPAGAKVQLQKSATAIQWRYEGDATWTDLVLLADITGAPGVGLTGSSIQYQASASGTAIPTGSWVNSPPAPVKGQYLWTRTVFTMSNGETPTSYQVGYWGTDGSSGTNGRGIASSAVTYQASTSGTVIPTGTWVTSPPAVTKGQYLWTRTILTLTDSSSVTSYSVAYAGTDGTNGTNGAAWLTGTAVPAAGSGANGDWYLRTPVGEIYQKASGAWSLLMTIGSGNITWYSGTAVPSNGTGKDGDLHLQENTGQIRKRVSGAWTNLILIPPLATSAQAMTADLSTIAATPAGVREFMEQWGWTANYMNNSTDLNTVTASSDRTVTFGFNASTLNTPVASSYGRGIMIAGGGNYSTQIAWINDTGDMYIRFHSGTTWSAWRNVAGIYDAANTRITWKGNTHYWELPNTVGLIAYSTPGGLPGINLNPGDPNGTTFSRNDIRGGHGYITMGPGPANAGTAGTNLVALYSNTWRPTVDNTMSLGITSQRWTQVFAVNATISTSDAREKTTPRQMSLAEVMAFSTIARLPGIWQWLTKVEEEGDEARLHGGPTVQDAIAVMGDNGLDWKRYSAFCYDEWEEIPDEWSEEVKDPDTGEILQARELRMAGTPAGNRYSFRKEELLMLITRALAHKQDDLEARLERVEAALASMNNS